MSGHRIEMMTGEIELVLDANARIGESPVWDERENVLIWVDIERGELHRLDPTTGRDEVFVVDGQLGAAVPRQTGGYVLACETGYFAYAPGGAPELLAEIEADDPATRINDARCDAAGRLWGGTLEQRLSPGRGALYCLETNGAVRRILVGVTASNGIDWSPDGRTMYYIDSRAYAVLAFDFDPETGTLYRPRRLIEYSPAPWVFPDGMTVDEEGFLWVAIFGAGEIRRYAPDGTLARAVTVPSRLVTSCGFGGPQLDQLYITSATHILEAGEGERQPYAGGVFRYWPGVRGRIQHAFGG